MELVLVITNFAGNEVTEEEAAPAPTQTPETQTP